MPESATREQLAQDMLVELSKLGCYFGSINGNWNTRSRLALDRFNRHAKLDLPLDEPQQASLDALKDWKGAHCPIEKAVPPRIKQRPVVAPKKQAPPRKAVRASPREGARPCKPCGHAHSLEKIMAATKYASYSAPSPRPPGPDSSEVFA